MTKLEHALRLARKGHHVFPLVPRSKLPAIKKYPELATRDESKIKAWWGENPEYNIGISTSRFGENEALIAVDVDNKKGKNGDAELLKLELSGKELPATYTQRTPTGGSHIILRAPRAVKQGVDVLGRGLDIRSAGGYVVGAGSETQQGVYTGNDSDVCGSPEWLDGLCVPRVSEPKSTTKQLPGVDPALAEARGKDYLLNHAPLAVEGDAGDQTTFKVFCVLKDLGCTKTQALNLALEHYNPRCSPEWSFEDLTKKVQSAYAYGQNPVGVSAPEAVFQPAPPSPSPGVEVPPEAKFYLDEMNKRYALIYIEGSHFILDETVDETGKPHRVYLTEKSFRMRFMPDTIQSTKKGKEVTKADVWLGWKGRREYQGICFSPEQEAKNGYYNTWRGFTVDPLPPEEATPEQRRGLELFLEHVRENCAGGNDEHFRWIIGFFAHMIQKPWERPLTALVFGGGKGVGKNSVVDRVGNLLGRRQYIVADDSRYLTSNFNGHLESCLCMVLDEAFWSGDKKSSGKLKGVVTGPEIMIERKGKEPYPIKNLVRTIVMGNEKWLVEATEDERRYAVFTVGDGRKQDRKFFEEMRILIDDRGGNRVLLHYLKNFDLSTTDINKIPMTAGLLSQKLQTMNSFRQWWFECLQECQIKGGDFMDGWPTEIAKDRLRRAYGAYANELNRKSWLPEERKFGRELSEVCPSVVANQKQKSSDGKYVYAYRLPPIEEARREWEKFIGQSIDWI